MTDAFDDLLGDGPADDSAAPSYRIQEVHHIVGGVSIPWLMKSFRMGREKVMKLLADGKVKPIGTHNNGGSYYDLPEAAACLVKPKQDFAAFLKTLQAKDLPVHMQDNFWAAKLKEQKWKVQAGELWPTSAVMQVFGDTFKMLKTKIQLWPDTLVESAGLTDAQRDILIELNNDLLNELSRELIEGTKANETRSQLADLDEIA